MISLFGHIDLHLTALVLAHLSRRQEDYAA